MPSPERSALGIYNTARGVCLSRDYTWVTDILIPGSAFNPILPGGAIQFSSRPSSASSSSPPARRPPPVSSSSPCCLSSPSPAREATTETLSNRLRQCLSHRGAEGRSSWRFMAQARRETVRSCSDEVAQQHAISATLRALSQNGHGHNSRPSDVKQLRRELRNPCICPRQGNAPNPSKTHLRKITPLFETWGRTKIPQARKARAAQRNAAQRSAGQRRASHSTAEQSTAAQNKTARDALSYQTRGAALSCADEVASRGVAVGAVEHDAVNLPNVRDVVELVPGGAKIAHCRSPIGFVSTVCYTLSHSLDNPRVVQRRPLD